MSIQTEIDRINGNIAATYDTLSTMGAEMPAQQNSDNLAATASGVAAVLYIQQALTEEQQAQARENIGAASSSGSSGTPSAHASTHATGGSDPITPASIGAAPAGFGLGEATPLIAGNSEAGQYDADLISKSCFFAAKTNTPTGDWCYGFHVNRIDNKAFQLMTDELTNNKEFAIRKKNGGTWGPWEWVNPPMKLGVEYRTTERYNGEAVYVTLNSDGTISKRTESGTDISPVTMDKVNTAISDAIGTVIGGSY